MNLACNAQKMGNVFIFAQNFHSNVWKAMEINANNKLSLSKGRVGTYRQVLRLFIKTITVCNTLFLSLIPK